MTRRFFCTRIIVSVFLLVGCSSMHTTPRNQVESQNTFGLLEVSSFDIYPSGNTLHLLISGKSATQQNMTLVRYLKSNDAGVHWSSAMDIPTQALSLATRGNDVQIAAQDDNIVAMWQVQGEIPNNGPLESFYSHDAGASWQRGDNPAIDNNGDQSHSDLLVDKKGYFHAVWLSDPEENGYQSLRYARSITQGEKWQAPLKLDDSTCSCCANTLALSPDEAIHVLYRDMNPRDMTMLSSNDHGETWQSKQTVGPFHWQFDGCPHVGGALAFDESNDFYSSVWTGAPNLSGLYAISAKSTVKIGKNATHSDLAVLENKIILVWDEMQPKGNQIFSAYSQDKGHSWSTPIALSKTGAFATHPRLGVIDNQAIVFWTQKLPKQASQLVMRWLD